MTNNFSNNHYNINLKEFARNLRNNSTLPEVILWNKILKRKQLRGYPFLRQRPIENYIVDFFCKDLKLIIEIDGKIHKFQKSKDKKREEELLRLGFSIIRFNNEEVLNELFNVERTLENFIDELEKENSNSRKNRNITP
jgi:very-short-patch-repair endonuclease